MSEYYDLDNPPEQSERKPETLEAGKKPEKPPKKKREPRRKGRLWLLIIATGVCLVAGILLAVWVAGIDSNLSKEEKPQATEDARSYEEEQDIEDVIEQETEEPDEEEPAAEEPETEGVEVKPILGGEAPDIAEYENPVIAIAENLGPAVVGIRTSVPDFTGGSMEEVDYAYGSGFVISDDGYIVTNHHVIEDAERYTVIMSDGTEYQAKLIGSDSYSDIAVLKIKVYSETLTVSPIGDSGAVRVGELAVAIGSPLGEYLSNSVTVGYISAINREVDGSSYLQTDAAINPGNSGGPLVNSKGEVIGINALKSYLAGFDEDGIPIATEGIGFAIPINIAMEVVQDILANGRAVRPGIGITYYPMTQDDAYIWEVPFGGLVEEVSKGGPADIAGITANDIIIAVNGEELTDPESLPNIIRDLGVGATITLTIWRGDDEQEIDIDVVIADLYEIE